MRPKTSRAKHVLAALLLFTSAHLAAQDKAEPEPTVWGATSGNTACVIFAEGHKTSGRFYGLAVTTRTVGKLTLIEAQNYSFEEKEVLETEENMNNLQQLAVKNRIKFVKIPEKTLPRTAGESPRIL